MKSTRNHNTRNLYNITVTVSYLHDKITNETRDLSMTIKYKGAKKTAVQIGDAIKDHLLKEACWVNACLFNVQAEYIRYTNYWKSKQLRKGAVLFVIDNLYYSFTQDFIRNKFVTIDDTNTQILTNVMQIVKNITNLWCIEFQEYAQKFLDQMAEVGPQPVSRMQSGAAVNAQGRKQIIARQTNGLYR